MTEPASQAAPRRIVLTLAVFALVAYFAAVVCAFGFASLLTDVSVIDEPDAGPLVGPVMVAAASVVLFIALVLIGIRMDATSRIVPVWSIIGAAVGASLAYLLSGALAYSATTGDAVNAVIFFAHHLFRPFTAVILILSLVVAVLYILVLLRQLHGGLRPLWPWERDEA
ncbi:MAG: DUF6121 family protein [Leifsonia sp.]